MNKNQVKLAAIGGVGVVLALAIGVFVYMESDSRAEKAAELEDQNSKIRTNAGANPKTAKAHNDNAAALKDWSDAAYGIAGGYSVRNIDPAEDPSVFRNRMVRRQRELVALPEGSEAKFIKPEFKFGERFQAYIDGAQPPASEMAALQREWDDVTRFTDILLESGATELTRVTVVPPPKAEEQPQGRGARRPAASSKKPAAEPYPGSDRSYEFEFTAKPDALVKVLDAVASDKARFMSVDSLSFLQAGDPLVAMVGGESGGADKSAQNAGRRGNRRNRRRGGADAFPSADAAGEDDDVSRRGIVTKPENAAPFTVTVKVTTTDFAKADAKEAGK